MSIDIVIELLHMPMLYRLALILHDDNDNLNLSYSNFLLFMKLMACMLTDSLLELEEMKRIGVGLRRN